MEKRFENVWFCYDTALNESFIGVKDREVFDGERWVLASLTKEELEELYSYLTCVLREESV